MMKENISRRYSSICDERRRRREERGSAEAKVLPSWVAAGAFYKNRWLTPTRMLRALKKSSCRACFLS
jgi:hypothetical protein